MMDVLEKVLYALKESKVAMKSGEVAESKWLFAVSLSLKAVHVPPNSYLVSRIRYLSSG
jgi:hypothetical protein